MKTTILLLILISFFETVIGQTSSCFSYDEQGNRIHRYDCIKEAKMSYIETTNKNTLICNNANIEIQVFPNPTKGNIMIEIQDQSKSFYGDISIFNEQGELIFNRFELIGTCVDLSLLPNGLYFLYIKIEDSTYSWKVIKEN